MLNRELSQHTTHNGQITRLFNSEWLCQYANSPGHGADCYTKLNVSSIVVAQLIAGTHRTCPRRDGQAELASGGWNTSRMVTNLVAYQAYIFDMNTSISNYCQLILNLII